MRKNGWFQPSLSQYYKNTTITVGTHNKEKLGKNDSLLWVLNFITQDIIFKFLKSWVDNSLNYFIKEYEIISNFNQIKNYFMKYTVRTRNKEQVGLHRIVPYCESFPYCLVLLKNLI